MWLLWPLGSPRYHAPTQWKAGSILAPGLPSKRHLKAPFIGGHRISSEIFTVPRVKCTLGIGSWHCPGSDRMQCNSSVTRGQRHAAEYALMTGNYRAIVGRVTRGWDKERVGGGQDGGRRTGG